MVVAWLLSAATLTFVIDAVSGNQRKGRYLMRTAKTYEDDGRTWPMPETEIIITHEIGRVTITPDVPGSAVGQAFLIAGDYLASFDNDDTLAVEFVAFGRRYRASQNDDR